MLALRKIQDISVVSELYAECDRELDADEVTIDGGGVEVIDTASLQVLCGFVRNLAQRDVSFHWVAKSDVLIASAKHLGILDELKLSTSEQ